MIRRYIIWRNNHAYDERFRRIVARASLDRHAIYIVAAFVAGAAR